MRKELGYKLVFTVALKAELPLKWLHTFQIPIFTLKALKAGILKKEKNHQKQILFIITGVGLENSQEAAEWICENLQPLYVVNLGTCGAFNQKIKIGTCVLPQRISRQLRPAISIEPKLPFPLAKEIKIKTIPELFSSETPVLKQDKKFKFFDMEAYAQAKVFQKQKFSFHVLKIVSDYGNQNSLKDYFENLPIIRETIKKLLFWLERQKEEPDFSVIIPVYNREEMVVKCLDSILAQKLKPREIIVVNDGSADNTKEVVEKYFKLHKGLGQILNFSTNKGVSAARNAGVKKAKGKWLAFCDSDDLWEPIKLEKQWQYLQENPFYEIMQSEEIWTRNGQRINQHKHHQKLEGWIFLESLKLCLISPSSVVMTKNFFEVFQGFDENLPACEDYDLWLRITREKPVGLESAKSLIKFGGHADQLSQKFEAIDQFRVKALIKILKREKNPDYQNAIKKVLEKKLEILIAGCRKRGKVEEAEKLTGISKELNLRFGT